MPVRPEQNIDAIGRTALCGASPSQSGALCDVYIRFVDACVEERPTGKPPCNVAQGAEKLWVYDQSRVQAVGQGQGR